ncbi:MAG: hypothetical protein KAU23_11215 [Anaerolineales bacterium]|nr:hypothetical protein [Anaerolineales bacterium]
MSNQRLEFAKNTAIETGKLLLDHFHHGKHQGELKSDRTLVTKADRDADQYIQKLIRDHFPSDAILSEEGNTIFPENPDVWVVDPLDGTVNFSLGLHYWGVSIAHFKHGIPQSAALYFPVIDELYSASAGKGADLNGKRIQVPNSPVDSHYPIFVHCSRMHGLYNVALPYKTRSLGAAAYHLCLIPKGSAILAFESTVKLWDFAGSWLVVKEAGGFIQPVGNQQPFPTQSGFDYNDRAFAIIAAASEDVMNKAAANIISK